MYISHGRVCACVCVCLSVCLSLSAFPQYCTDPDGSWEWQGCHLVVHYWADLQSVHGFRCYDNIVPNTKCQQVLVLALCLVHFIINLLLGWVVKRSNLKRNNFENRSVFWQNCGQHYSGTLLTNICQSPVFCVTRYCYCVIKYKTLIRTVYVI